MGFKAQIGSSTLRAVEVFDVEGDVDPTFTFSKEIGVSSSHGVTRLASKGH